MPPINAHALVVGIADYPHITRLPRVKDAPEIAAVLTNESLGGYPPGNVKLLEESAATGAAVRAELAALADRADADSCVFIYFSGHGGRVDAGPHAGEYLLPFDTRYPPDEELARTAISGKEFNAALDRLRSRKVFVVFDCCHAAGVGQPKHIGVAQAIRPGLSADYYQAVAAGRGRAVLASSRADEYSYVPHGAEYGLFTQHLLAGLKGGVVSTDGLVRVFDLFSYVQPRVTKARSDQHPYFRFEGEENLPVARYQGGAGRNAPPTDDGYPFDVYVCFSDREPDRGYVWRTLCPKLEEAGLRVAVSNDSEDPGVARVVGMERAVRQARRTAVLITDQFLSDHWTEFLATMTITIGLDEGKLRLLPMRIGPVTREVPAYLSQLVTLDLAHPYRAENNWQRLIKSLRADVPRMGG
jgi:hypothetical protein